MYQNQNQMWREEFHRYLSDCLDAGEFLPQARGINLDEGSTGIRPVDFKQPIEDLLGWLESDSGFLPRAYRDLLGMTDRNSTYADAVELVRGKLASRCVKKPSLRVLLGGVPL